MSDGLGAHFVGVLESLGMASRLRQGRLAARAGQVLSMSLSTSVVVAQVQDGSRSHRCRIGIKAFTKPEWVAVEKALASQALHAARLLSGEVPYEMFADLGLRLFPDDMRELAMDCTCDTWDMPCQHLAAVCHLLAELFDQDPFQALAWRGRSREELLPRLGELRRRTQEPQPIKGFWRMQRPGSELPTAPATAGPQPAPPSTVGPVTRPGTGPLTKIAPPTHESTTRPATEPLTSAAPLTPEPTTRPPAKPMSDATPPPEPPTGAGTGPPTPEPTTAAGIRPPAPEPAARVGAGPLSGSWPGAESAGTTPSGRPDAVLDELAPLPLELRGERIVDLLRPAYHTMARRPND